MQANSPNHIQVQKYKENFVVAYFIKTSVMKLEIRYFSRRILSSRLGWQRNVPKKYAVRAKLLFCSIKPIPFYTFSSCGCSRWIL